MAGLLISILDSEVGDEGVVGESLDLFCFVLNPSNITGSYNYSS